MNLRGDKRTEFPLAVRKKAFVRCCREGVPHCETCGVTLTGGNIIYEHIKADGLGGDPVLENCKVHCKGCANLKTYKEDNPLMIKADRMLKKSYGLTRKKKPMMGSKASGWKQKIGGGWQRRP